MHRCPDCGAEQRAGESCEECFHALLAFEAERPEAFGAVHHLTVACYYVQHPRGYSSATLRAWRELIADALDDTASVAQLRARNERRFGGAARVREPNASPPEAWPREWNCHVADVIRPGESLAVGDYVRRARAWAESVRATLDAGG
jgi:hypothetical protein